MTAEEREENWRKEYNEHQRYLRHRRKLRKQHDSYWSKLSAGESITAKDRQGEQEYIEDCYHDNLKHDLQNIKNDLSRILATAESPGFRGGLRGYRLNKLAYYLTLEELQELKEIADKIYVYANILYHGIENQETEHINRTGGQA